MPFRENFTSLFSYHDKTFCFCKCKAGLTANLDEKKLQRYFAHKKYRGQCPSEVLSARRMLIASSSILEGGDSSPDFLSTGLFALLRSFFEKISFDKDWEQSWGREAVWVGLEMGNRATNANGVNSTWKERNPQTFFFSLNLFRQKFLIILFKTILSFFSFVRYFFT